MNHPSRRKTIIGMVHLAPLPGTPFHRNGSLPEIVSRAVAAARALDEGGADGCLVQTADRVYTTRDASDPARVAAMSLVVQAVVEATRDGFDVGVHMLRNDLTASLAVAQVAGGTFIRAGAFIGRTETVHGLVEPDPVAALEYRAKIGAESVAIIADVHSMHFRAIDQAKSVGEVAKNARLSGAAAVAVGAPDPAATLRLLADVRTVDPAARVFLAGYTNHDNVAALIREADGAYVGGCLERGSGVVDVELVKRFIHTVRSVEQE
ncbi:BtpA/SgcQ family protein [Micromonospora sp. CPCC 205546]|uniref:BtpA/SgcQ family protein n=1 Tax=Micromonospora sp. CPCC 205546 TaxID=3122397 RepID=UPI002FF1292C